jgi:hypothetical protein
MALLTVRICPEVIPFTERLSSADAIAFDVDLENKFGIGVWANEK